MTIRAQNMSSSVAPIADVWGLLASNENLVKQLKSGFTEYGTILLAEEMWASTFENVNTWLTNDRLNPLGLSVAVTPSSSGGSACVLKARGRVGVSRLGPESASSLVVVKPKVGVDQFATMLRWAYFPDMDEQAVSLLAAQDLILIVPALFLAELRKLLLRLGNALRKSYMVRSEVLSGRIRGRPMISDYISAQVPKFRHAHIPCRWQDLTVDNDYNRALRLGIAISEALYRWLERSGGTGISSEYKRRSLLSNPLSELHPKFAGVTLDHEVRHRIGRLRCAGNFTLYRPCLELLRFLIDHVDIAFSGNEVSAYGVTVEMHDVFEKCIVNFLRHSITCGNVIRQEEHGWQCSDSLQLPDIKYPTNRVIKPDAVVRAPGKVVVLDVKWKEVWEARSEEDVLLLNSAVPWIRPSDLYQVVAYGSHQDIQASAGVLVYPKPEDAGPGISLWRVDGFVLGGDFPVWVLGVPTKSSFHEGLKDMSRFVSDLVEGKINS